MTRVPTYLKGLAERRARFDADVLRLETLQEEIAQALEGARKHRESCDLLIKHYDEALEPNEIAPIQGWKGRYGKRGELKESAAQFIRENFPDEVTTTELAWALQAKFKLDFPTGSVRKRWVHNSLVRALKILVSEGRVERLHDIEKSTGQSGRWRWLQDEPSSLGHLRAQVEAQGIAIQQNDDDHE